MDPLTRRHSDILEILERRGYAAIEELVEAFNVTPQTLRRDLQDLHDRGLLRRHHGGASANISTANADYGLRHVEAVAEKAAIGRAAARLIKPGQSLFLSAGTTVDAFAKAVADAGISGLRIVTNSITAAAFIDKAPGISIQITGGLWLGHNRQLGGHQSAAFIEHFRCDVMLGSIGGIDPEGNLLEYRDDDAVMARAMFRNARRRILLADHTKFTRVAMCRVGHLADVSTFITDRRPGPAARRLIEAAGCELIVAME